MRSTLTRTLALASLALASLAAPAAAQAPNDPGVDVTEHDFTDAEQVDGTRQSPWLDLLQGTRRVRTGSLIRTRSSFTPEMLKSVEDL